MYLNNEGFNGLNVKDLVAACRVCKLSDLGS